MFAIYSKTPVYNNRDAVDHSIIRRESAYSYETAALAQRLAPSGYDEDGQSSEVTYFVADAADPWARVATKAQADDGFDDIPF